MSTTIAPPAPVAQAEVTPIDPGAIQLGDFIVTPAGDVADVRSRETGYSWVILGTRDRTGRTDLWSYALGDKVERLAGGAR